MNGKQHTVRFHVDDLLSSHVDPKVNDRFAEWLEKMYGKYKAVEPTRGKKHDYLGMVIDFTEKGKVIIDMVKYVESMIEDFPMKISKISKHQLLRIYCILALGNYLIKQDQKLIILQWQKDYFYVKGPDLTYNQQLLC